jgi:hypothetical protein
MIRRIALSLFLLPLALNGLWLICREAPPETSPEISLDTSSEATPEATLVAQAAEPAQSAAQKRKAECERICGLHPGAGALCLLTPGNKTSLSIVILGLSILQAATAVRPPAVARRTAPEFSVLHFDPCIADPAPPPRASA